MEDKYRQLHSTVSEQVDAGEEDEDGSGDGINIDEAKQRLQQQDAVDKQLYRDRVQQKHRVSLYFFILFHFVSGRQV